MGIRNWDFTRSKPSNFPLKLRGRIVTSLLTWTSFYHSVILFSQYLAHYAVCVCMCVCILLSVLVHFLHLFPYLSISFLVPKFLSSFREKEGGKATFSQFPFFSTIVSLLKVSTFGQPEGGEEQIGQIEGGLGWLCDWVVFPWGF